MSKIAKYSHGWNDEFYRVDVSSRRVHAQQWIARATVRRIDSNEEVGGKQHLHETCEAACDLLEESFDVYLEAFPRPPPEWGQVAIRRLLADYKIFNHQLVSSLFRLQNSQQAGDLSADILHSEYWTGIDLTMDRSVYFVRRLIKLTEIERIQLMISPDDVYLNPSNPWNLDDADARSNLFRFIVEPSKEVIRAHAIHEARRIGDGNVV